MVLEAQSQETYEEYSKYFTIINAVLTSACGRLTECRISKENHSYFTKEVLFMYILRVVAFKIFILEWIENNI